MTKVNPIPHNDPRVTPYLWVAGAADAIAFYETVHGAKERMRIPMPDGKIGHAELAIGEGLIMLSDEYPDIGVLGPKSIGGTPVTISVYVEDVDWVHRLALEAGAKELRPPEDQFYGDRGSKFEDPWGHRWGIVTHIEDVSPEEMAKRMSSANME